MKTQDAIKSMKKALNPGINSDEDFSEAVDDFINRCFSDYFMKAIFVVDDFDQENYWTATIQAVTTAPNYSFEIPVCVEEGQLKIDVGDQGTLNADGEGLMCWLWNETMQRLMKVEGKI